MLLTLVVSVISLVDHAREATVYASSYYDISPYETTFLPRLAVDGDDSTSWSSKGEGCQASFHMDLIRPTIIESVCARSRDMVDTTDDSVIESFDILSDDTFVRTCVLPDWRQIYCCTIDPQTINRISLRAKTCRERPNAPGNTGFRTVQLFGPSNSDEPSVDVSVVGNRNIASKAVHNLQVLGSDTRSELSDRGVLIGHHARSLSSDKASIVGTNINITSSDDTIAIGHMIQVYDSDFSIAMGTNLHVLTPSQIVLGSFNDATSSAKFVVAAGSQESPVNLFEVYADGRIVNSYIAILEARISTLEERIQDAFECKSIECEDIKVAFNANGCCNT